MLGITKTASPWKWVAFGKHPLAGDYFYAGHDDPLFQAFSGWVDTGFRKIGQRMENATGFHSWRFCGKSPAQDILLCGFGRDSFDHLGRPYPLFIMGAGPLPGYLHSWDLLPFVLETLWSRMEYMGSKRYIDFSQLEADVQRLPAPENNWKILEEDRKKRWDAWCRQSPPDQEKIRKALQAHTGTTQCLIPFVEDVFPDVTSTIGLWFSFLKTEEPSMFGTAFFGGNLPDNYLAVFRRPLCTDDFISLWFVNEEQDEVAQTL